MASKPSLWPLTTLLHRRTVSTLSTATTYTPPPRIHFATRPNPTLPRRRIKVYPPPPGPLTTDPISALTTAQIKALDPSGSRAELFSRQNPQAIRPGDIVYVRRKNGEPFSGVLLNIRRRGIDTSILLRDHLTKLGVEMWLKVYSPIIDSINLVQRKEKMARRAKLYYMRKPAHDFGPVRGIVSDWVRKSYAAKKGSADKASQS
ncbi:unnamed protein product, partial [Tuber aestivum]